jgi:hypothetical protein
MESAKTAMRKLEAAKRRSGGEGIAEARGTKGQRRHGISEAGISGLHLLG